MAVWFFLLIVQVSSQECFFRSPPILDKSEKLSLCDQATDPGPAECATFLIQNNIEKEFAIQLCKGIGTLQTAKCVLRSPQNWEISSRAALCLPNTNSFQNEIAPAECARRVLLHLDIGEKETVQLCQNSTDNGPFLCASALPRMFPVENLLQLCSAGALARVQRANFVHEKSIAMPATCATTALRFDSFLDPSIATSLCLSSNSTLPSTCWIKLHSILPKQQDRLRLCRQLDDPQVIDCIGQAFQKLRGWGASALIDLCRPSVIVTNEQESLKESSNNQINLLKYADVDGRINCSIEGQKLGIKVDILSHMCAYTSVLSLRECVANIRVLLPDIAVVRFFL